MMNKATFEYKFKIYQPVWHVASGKRCIVIDISYSLLHQTIKYYISADVGEADWCYEGELSDKEVIL